MLRTFLILAVLVGASAAAPAASAGACVGLPPDLMACVDCVMSQPGPTCAPRLPLPVPPEGP